jgi:hypothetical protein
MSTTFGASGSPSQIIKNLDALFSTSMAAYKKTLTDQIGASNPVFFEILKKKLYDSDSGTHIEVPLLYALTDADSYSGYDELPTTPVDGITSAVFEWAQCAVPISISMKEIKQNAKKIVNLMETKQKQAEMGLQEYFNQAFMWGAANDGVSSLSTIRTSPVNGSNSITPLGRLVKFDPTTTTSIGNIDQGANTWWRNQTKTSAATTYDGFLKEFMNIFNTCALGTGGKPDIVVIDQISWELLSFALYARYRATSTDTNYPFPNLQWNGATIVMEDKTPDAYTDVKVATTYGSAYFLNTQFLKLTHEEGSDFELLKDENGKAFQKPTNQDSRLAHMAWMGNTTISNRRKQGVLGKIARTLS